MTYQPDKAYEDTLERLKRLLKLAEEGTSAMVSLGDNRFRRDVFEKPQDLKEAVTLTEATKVITMHVEAAHLRVVEARVHVAMALKELREPTELPGLQEALDKMLKGEK